LCREDFAVTAFTDGMNALRAAHSAVPDLLISETEMAPLSGIDLARRLQKCCPDCKVLLFSGQWASAESLEIARSTGLEFETIPKPVDPKELIQKVRDMTTDTSRSAAKNRALKTYNDNARETLSRLSAAFTLPK
jgi:DNA-binding NtrC family response regulator